VAASVSQGSRRRIVPPQRRQPSMNCCKTRRILSHVPLGDLVRKKPSKPKWVNHLMPIQCVTVLPCAVLAGKYDRSPLCLWKPYRTRIQSLQHHKKQRHNQRNRNSRENGHRSRAFLPSTQATAFHLSPAIQIRSFLKRGRSGNFSSYATPKIRSENQIPKLRTNLLTLCRTSATKLT